MLMAWGTITFEVYPLNIGEVDHTTATDWSKKEIAGASIYREWVGEGDETISLRGKVFPHFMASTGYMPDERRGGFSDLDLIENRRRLGQAHILIRGDGWNLGWYVIERFSRGHTFLGSQGVGQQVAFEAVFLRVPVPGSEQYYTNVTSPSEP